MLPTGSGKTVIAKEIKKRFSDMKFLFLAPKKNLLTQTAESFAELSPQVIHGTKQYDQDSRVFVSTIQTMSRRPELIESMKFDYIIFDEMHYGAAGEMQQVIKAAHSGNIIGLSATPYDKYGKLLTGGFDTVIKDYDARYMVDNGYLSPINVVAPFEADLTGVRTVAGDYNLKDLDEKVNTPKMIIATIEATAAVIKARYQTIVFTTSISHSENISSAYAAIGIDVAVLHSEQPKSMVEKTLTAFRNSEIKVLVSVNMITEGFDVPAVDTVVICRPTKSPNLYKQMIGRGMRLSPDTGKSDCLLIDCGGVVKALGMPLDKITERKKGQAKYICVECGSNAPKRVKITHDEAYTYCPVCLGNKTDYVGEVDTCESCSRIYHIKDYQDNYEITANGIYLHSDCGHKQLVSSVHDLEVAEAVVALKKDRPLTKSAEYEDCAGIHLDNIFRTHADEVEEAYPDIDKLDGIWRKYRLEKIVAECYKSSSSLVLRLVDQVVKETGSSRSSIERSFKTRASNYQARYGKKISNFALKKFADYMIKSDAE